MLKKLIVIIGIILIAFGFTDAGEKKDATADEKSLTIEVPPLLRPIAGESETDKLKRMIQYIKETKPKPFIGSPAAPQPEPPFCKQFMGDLINMHGVKAIEPDFVVNYGIDIVNDIDIAKEEITRKLNVKHCEDMEHGSIIPPDVNPSLYRRGTLGFNYIGDVGGPPYRVYKLRLKSNSKVKHTIVYYDGWEYGHTGFARLDLKKCEIKDDKGGYSEIEHTNKPTLFEIGKNVLVTYKGQILALMIEYSDFMTSNRYRLELYKMSIPITKGWACHWSYYSDEMKERRK